MYSSRERGFTLIEIIIAVSIGALLILVTSASIRTGLSYMQRGEERFNKGLRERVALNFIIQQITSIRSHSTPDKDVFFIGEKDLVSFISPLSVNKYYTYGLMICAYTVTKEEGDTYSLVYSEKRLLSNEYLTELTGKFGEKISRNEFFVEESIAFFQGCEEITFEYLGEGNTDNDKEEEKEEGPWKKSWENEEGLPRAIRITFLKRGKTQKAIAPIMVTS